MDIAAWQATFRMRDAWLLQARQHPWTTLALMAGFALMMVLYTTLG